MNKLKAVLCVCILGVLALCAPGYAATNKPVIQLDGTAAFEAECDAATVLEPMYIQEDEGASGGAYVGVRNDSAIRQSSPKRDVAQLTYQTYAPQDDAYYVWARCLVYEGGVSRYYACFDDGIIKLSWMENCTAEGNYDTWQWNFVGKYWLTEGEHTFKIRYGYESMYYDSFIITTDHTFTPEGAPPAVTPADEIYSRNEKGEIENLYYNLPAYLPPDEHPRLLFRKSDIERIKSNLTHPQNIAEYEYLLELAAYETDGKNPTLTYGQITNVSQPIASFIESNAFLYQITGDEAYGMRAVEVCKNYLESAMVDPTSANATGRTGMTVVWAGALCYDWCYDLLTEEDKAFMLFHMSLQSSYSEPGFPSIGYTNTDLMGHILEFQLLQAQFAMAVAVYDEAPDVYNVVAGRILQDIVPVVSYMNQATFYMEGTSYGMYRHYFEIMNNYMFRAMGYPNVYDENGQSAYGNMYIRQPNGQMLTAGDYGEYYKTGYCQMTPGAYFLLGNMYKNPYLKTEYYRKNLGTRKSSAAGNTSVSPAMWLIINDVDVPCDASFRDFPLTTYTGLPTGYLLARTSWDEGITSDSVVCLMNIQQRWHLGHAHKDSGHFSLYYKGILAMDSGIYEGTSFTDSTGTRVTSVGYNSNHHIGYTRQSIAHNTVLVKDPNEELPDPTRVPTNDGGQKMSVLTYEAKAYEDLGTEKDIVGEVLSYNWGPDLKEPVYSYMKGDLTDAYSSKVESFQRSFMFLNFKDDTYPAALIVFDSVRAASPTFEKTWLLHSEEEPQIDGDTVTIARTAEDYNGRLVNQTLLPDNGFTTKKVGGEGYEFYVDGVNYEMAPKSDEAEVGNWRIEISPTTAEKQSYFLNVMQVSDNDDAIVPLEAKLVENTDVYAGVEINAHVAYFRKDGASLRGDVLLRPGEAEGERFFAVTGLAAGKWTVYDAQGQTVAEAYAYDGHGSICFTAAGAEFTLKWSYEENLQAPDYSIMGLTQRTEKSIDVSIDGGYESFENDWFEYEGNVFAPVVETLEKLDVRPYTESFTQVDVTMTGMEYSFVYGQNGVTRFNGLLYAPVQEFEKALKCIITYDSVSKIITVNYGRRERDTRKIYRYDDPAVAQIVYAYTEGETTAAAVNSIDGNTATYSCTIGADGTFVAMLEQPETISNVALFWISGSKRQEIFDMYVSEDGREWELVFSGMSDGVTDGYEYMPVGGSKKYQYVKLVCQGNTLNSYNSLAEIIVYK